jgi:hypothetical protein
MAWHVKTTYRDGSEDIVMDDVENDLPTLVKQKLSTGSTATGINKTTGELEVYWFTESPIKDTDGTWDKI